VRNVLPAQRRGIVRALLLSLVLLTLTLPAAPAPADASCASPPAVFPVSQIQPGMTGTGLTTLSGNTPVPFDIRVIGIAANAIAPGFDLVFFEITGPQSFLDASHGFAAGMSGSPVYIQGRLAGATSYKYFPSGPAVGAFTPAEYMVSLVQGSSPAPALPRSIHVSRSIRASVARAAGVPAVEAPSTAQRLAIPLGVTGITAARLQHLQDLLERKHLPFVAYAAGAASDAAGLVPTPLAPGQPMAAALSYGDVSYFGLATVTFACGSLDVGWGHPFFFNGQVSFGMNDADIVTVLDDPSGLYGPTKFGNLTEAHGTIVQDRLAGIVGQAGDLPPMAPVTTTFTDLDTGRSRSGETDILYQKGFWGPEIVGSHVFTNLQLVFDQYGAGTLNIRYTIDGETADGTPFTVQNRSMAYSEYDATSAAYKLTEAMYQLAFNRFEPVTFTSVHAEGEISARKLVGTITRIRTASTLQPALAERRVLRARPGTRITIETTLTPADGGPNVVATMHLRVPVWARGVETVGLRGGTGRSRVRGRVRSFDQLLALLNGGGHPNDLIATGFGTRLIQAQDLIVKGKGSFDVSVVS